MATPGVLAVHTSATHSFSKAPQPSIHLLAGLGVAGDAHCGATVRHRYLVRRDPAAPNRTQVHLLESEFLAALAVEITTLHPGDLGENITTLDIDLCSLPLGTLLHLGATAVVELTGLRSPCSQMNKLRPGLMQAAFVPGTWRPRAGVMAIVHASGLVHPSDPLGLSLPAAPHQPLRPI